LQIEQQTGDSGISQVIMVMLLRSLGFLAVLGAADAHVAISAQPMAGVPVTSSDVDSEADKLETTPEPACPSNFSTGPDMHGDCKCNDGSDCYYQGEKGACPHAWSQKSASWFSWTCVDCICQAPPPTPAPEPTPPPTPDTTPAPTPEPSCPSDFSTGPDMHGDCKCNEGSDCYYRGEKGACPHAWSQKSASWFSWACVDCICKAEGTPAPTPVLPTLAPASGLALAMWGLVVVLAFGFLGCLGFYAGRRRSNSGLTLEVV